MNSAPNVKINKKNIPRAESTRTTQKKSNISFDYSKDQSYLVERKFRDINEIEGTHQIAAMLSDEIQIVAESRSEIENGDFITWEEYKKIHAKTRKK